MPGEATALNLASNECANWRGSGSCAGMTVHGDACNPLPRGLLRDGIPCRYFEKCLLPLLKSYPKYHGADGDYIDQTLGTRIPEALSGHPFVGHTARYMTGKASAERFCGCGAPLGPRKRMCPECARKRRKETNRANVKAWRESHADL